MNKINEYIPAFFHLFYPHICIGCGSDILDASAFLCVSCIDDLPHTNFADLEGNPVERMFWGRVDLFSATSEFYFSKQSVVQNLIHEFKYNGNKNVGLYLGEFIGKSIRNSKRFESVDALIPLPLFFEKEKLRGYNQAAILCDGISAVTGVPVILKNVVRTKNTSTQTRKGRIQRWQNVEQSFSVSAPEALAEKHVLLVDDVVTTGATLEACAMALLRVPDIRISIATLATA